MANRIFIITPLDMDYPEYHSYVDGILKHAQKLYGHCRLVWTREIKGVKPGNHPLLNITAILNRVKCYEAFYSVGNPSRQDAVSSTLKELFARLDRPVYNVVYNFDVTTKTKEANKKKKKEEPIEKPVKEDEEEFFIEDDEEYPPEKKSFFDGMKKNFKKFLSKED